MERGRTKIYLVCETLNELQLSFERRRLQLVLSNVGDGSANSLAELRLQKVPKYASCFFFHCLTGTYCKSKAECLFFSTILSLREQTSSNPLDGVEEAFISPKDAVRRALCFKNERLLTPKF